MVKFGVAIAVMGSMAAALSQEPPRAERPAIKVGDAWTLERTNRSGGTLEVRREVKAVTPEALTVVVTDTAGTTEQQWTPDLNYVSGEGKRVLRPSLQYLSFPLSVGREWKVDLKGTNAAGRDLTSEGRCKVLAYEKVTTRAGSFDAFKIECDIEFYIYGGQPVRGREKYLYWYAPAVRGEVRAERLTRDALTVFFDWTQELVSTTVKP
jgi:hypothetical protein